MRRPRIDEIAFFLSAVLLAMLWGYGARAFGHFPHGLLDRAMRQGERSLSPPTFVSPRSYERVGARTLVPGAVRPGLTLVAGVWEEHDWASALRLIDAEGRVHHEWIVDPGALFADSVNRKGGGTERAAIHGSRLLPDGDVVFNFNYVGTVRADACGRVLWSLPAGSHHSVERADDGSFWIPGSSLRGPAATEHRPEGFPGIEGPSITTSCSGSRPTARSCDGSTCWSCSTRTSSSGTWRSTSIPAGRTWSPTSRRERATVSPRPRWASGRAPPDHGRDPSRRMPEIGDPLVTETRTRRGLEAAPEGRTVWEWVTTL